VAERKKLGEILVEAKVITVQQLNSGLAHQKQWGGRLGSALLEKGFLSEDILAKFLSLQLNYPSVTLSKVKVNMDVLQRVPRELQDKYNCVPIAILKEGKRESLILAMCDPTDVSAVDAIGFATGLKVKPVVATESAIKKFLGGDNAFGTSFREQSVSRDSEDADFEVVRGTMDSATGAGAVPSRVSSQSAVTVAREAPVRRATNGRGVEPSQSPLGEQELDLDETSSDVVLGAPIMRGTVPAPGSAAPGPDPFVAAVMANAKPVAPPPAVSPQGTIGAGGSLFGDLESLLGPSIGTGQDERTEPEIDIAQFAAASVTGIPNVAAPPPPSPVVASITWDTMPGIPSPMVPATPLIGTAPAQESSDVVVARGVLQTDEPMPEISLPGPEPLPPPPDLLLESPSKAFEIPNDLELAEPTIFDSPIPEPESIPMEAASDVPPLEQPLAEEPALEQPPFEEPPLEQPPLEQLPFEQPPHDVAPMESAWIEPAPVEPAPMEAENVFDTEASASMPSSTDGPVPVMTSLGGGSDLDLENDHEGTVLGANAFEPTWSGEPSMGDFAYDHSPTGTRESVPLVETFETAAPAVEEMPVEAGMAADGGEQPAFEPSESTAPAAPRAQNWQAGAAEADPWPEDPAAPAPLAPVAPESAAPSAPIPVGTPVFEISRETAASTSPPPRTRAPVPTRALAREPTPVADAGVAPAPAAVAARPELTPDPLDTGRGPMIPGISEEQAALNLTISKKLKLLNAMAELLLEKGVITEDEIKEKISKKRGHP
jgi:hypothetical protein